MRYEITRFSNGYLVTYPLKDDKIAAAMVYSLDDAFDFIRAHDVLVKDCLSEAA